MLAAAALYFVPAYVGRKKPNATTVLVVNLFLGWTFIGWVVALARATSNPPLPVATPPTTHVASTPTGRICPFCAEDIKPAAIVCKHCGRDLSGSE